MDFANLVFIITGASKGIGKTLAEILSKQGATVIGTYYSNPITNEKIDYYHCDVTDEESISKLFSDIKNKYGHINSLINCAAASADDFYLNKKVESFMKVLRTNVIGTFLLCKHASLNLEPGGVIVNLSSLDATDTYNEYNMDYACSKAAVENITKNFAKTVKNIKTVALAPAWVDTESTLEMDPRYLKEELQKNNQEALLKKEEVALKIIEMIIDSNIVSGDIVVMK